MINRSLKQAGRNLCLRAMNACGKGGVAFRLERKGRVMREEGMMEVKDNDGNICGLRYFFHDSYPLRLYNQSHWGGGG